MKMGDLNRLALIQLMKRVRPAEFKVEVLEGERELLALKQNGVIVVVGDPQTRLCYMP